MSECKDISDSIKKLSHKIDNYQRQTNTELKRLKSDIRTLNNKVSTNQKDITFLMLQYLNTNKITIETKQSVEKLKNMINSKADEDLGLIKSRIGDIEKYINALDEAGSQIISILQNFASLFGNIF